MAFKTPVKCLSLVSREQVEEQWKNLSFFLKKPQRFGKQTDKILTLGSANDGINQTYM